MKIDIDTLTVEWVGAARGQHHARDAWKTNNKYIYIHTPI